MKKNCFTVLFLLVSFLSTSSFCGASLQFVNNLELSFNDTIEDRVYVQPDQVHILDNSIFLNFNGEFIQVNMLCSDIRGIYVPSFLAGKALGDCPNGHSRTCATCHVCYRKSCSYGCKCR